MNYTYWHQTAARTSHTRIIFYNLYLIYMQVCETFLNKKWQTVMWHCECEQSIHVQQPRGLDSGGKVLALAKATTFLSRPRPRPEVSRPRPRPSWGVLEDPRGQGQASRTTRLAYKHSTVTRWTCLIFPSCNATLYFMTWIESSGSLMKRIAYNHEAYCCKLSKTRCQSDIRPTKCFMSQIK